MREQSRIVLAHLALAVSRYLPEAARAARRDGDRVPGELLVVASFLADLADRDSGRQTTTAEAPALGARHAEVMPEPMLLTKAQAAVVLGVSVRSLERLIARGELVAVGVGGSTKLRRADVDAFVAALAPRSFRDITTTKESA